jgi:hypothetical protein
MKKAVFICTRDNIGKRLNSAPQDVKTAAIILMEIADLCN